MTGGPNAAVIACLCCALESAVQPARRIQDGTENDWNQCAYSHEFGADFGSGPLPQPLWPLSEEEAKSMEARAKNRGFKQWQPGEHPIDDGYGTLVEEDGRRFATSIGSRYSERCER